LIYTKTGERVNFGHKESFEPFVYYYVASAEDHGRGKADPRNYTGAMEYPTSLDRHRKNRNRLHRERSHGLHQDHRQNQSRPVDQLRGAGRRRRPVSPHPVHRTKKAEKTTYRYGGESYLEGNLLTEITEPNGAVTKLS